jgi:hypothetical protein
MTADPEYNENNVCMTFQDKFKSVRFKYCNQLVDLVTCKADSQVYVQSSYTNFSEQCKADHLAIVSMDNHVSTLVQSLS